MQTHRWRPVVMFFLAIALVLAPLRVRAAEPDAKDLLARMRNALEPGKDMRATVVFTIKSETKNERGETVKGENVTWTGHLYRRGGAEPRSRIVFDDPPDLKGTSVSVVRSGGAVQTRVYLPALRRVRVIDKDTRGESFLGTDFNYEDLGLQPLDDQQPRVAASQDPSCGYRVESTPGSGWWYGRVVRCIDKSTYLPLRTEYYDRSGTLWKVRTLGGVKKVGKYPTPSDIAMETVPQKSSTTIALSDVQYDTGLPDRLFETP